MRLAVTELDAWRWHRDKPDAVHEDMVSRLRYRSTATPRMMAGRAFHTALEYADYGDHDHLEADGYLFLLDPGFSCTLELTPTRELLATKTYLVDGQQVTLVGKVDGIFGRRVDDHKFSAGFPADRLLEGYQWRCYLDIFEAETFRWNVFSGREGEARDTYVITAFNRLEARRYAGMSEDVRDQLAGLVRFVRAYVPERADPNYRRR